MNEAYRYYIYQDLLARKKLDDIEFFSPETMSWVFDPDKMQRIKLYCLVSYQDAVKEAYNLILRYGRPENVDQLDSSFEEQDEEENRILA